jgi:hypothetical protein
MKLILVYIIFSLLLFQDQTRYKSNDEFELKLDLQFKKRPGPDMNKVDLEKRTLPTAGMNAPYLYIDLRVLKPVAEESRVKVLKNGRETLMSRKFDPNLVIKLDLGFTDDIKDQVTPHHYLVTFLSKDKEPLSRIEIVFEEDGTYIVNGEKRGKI